MGFTISDTNVETPTKVPIFSYKLKKKCYFFVQCKMSDLENFNTWGPTNLTPKHESKPHSFTAINPQMSNF